MCEMVNDDFRNYLAGLKKREEWGAALRCIFTPRPFLDYLLLHYGRRSPGFDCLTPISSFVVEMLGLINTEVLIEGTYLTLVAEEGGRTIILYPNNPKNPSRFILPRVFSILNLVIDTAFDMRSTGPEQVFRAFHLACVLEKVGAKDIAQFSEIVKKRKEEPITEEA